VRWPQGQLYWYNPEDVKRSLASAIAQYGDCAVLCHHAHFDGLILSHVYDVRPPAWLDTLAMARLLVGNHLPLGLDALARHFGLAGKILNYASFKGRHWSELDAATRAGLAAGCLHDVELTWQLFNRLAPSFPVEEYPIVDETIRLFTEPELRGPGRLLGALAR
jgi:DNA polymerase III epsilon subunit-like protein